jgi:hypothetical protein
MLVNMIAHKIYKIYKILNDNSCLKKKKLFYYFHVLVQLNIHLKISLSGYLFYTNYKNSYNRKIPQQNINQ